LVVGLIGPMKSTSHFSNACRAWTGCIGNSSHCDNLPTRWQTSHDLVYTFASLKSVVHQSPSCRNLCSGLSSYVTSRNSIVSFSKYIMYFMI
jgi:hypothetical protein